MANAQSVFELRAIKEAELNAMNRDLKEMAREDVRILLLSACFYSLLFSAVNRRKDFSAI